MSRKRTAPEDIREPEHYFNRYIAMEVRHDQVRLVGIEDREISLDERFEEVVRTGALNAEGCVDAAERTSLRRRRPELDQLFGYAGAV